MSDPEFNQQDLAQIEARGITRHQVLAQIETFKKGIPFLKLKAPCTIQNGIQVLEKNDLERLTKIHSRAASQGRLIKFVPASGAASRMFRLLHSVRSRPDLTDEKFFKSSAGDDPEKEYFLNFINKLDRFAFYDDLKSGLAGQGLDLTRPEKHAKAIIDYLLYPQGLNYAALPKGLIKFHRYPDRSRTALEEHLIEAKSYVSDKRRAARVHFTVSPEHEELFKKYIDKIRIGYEEDGTRFEFEFSRQKPSTETIAVDLDNRPFRDGDGELLFRPAGHGALLENLNDLKGDLIYIKNIDNVAPDWLKPDTIAYKKALAGRLIELQERLFKYMARLTRGQADEQLLEEILTFTISELLITPPTELAESERKNQVEFLISALNRPIRVCGMVKNVSDPGGGPFWVEDERGVPSPQIVELAQVDMGSDSQRGIWESSTHFNPVDLVCGVRDYKGNNFNLMDFRDPDTGFISRKSKDGRDLKALELPGLWNGSMARWITVFVEVPLSTFNPVKTVNDLLRPQHQNAED